MDRSDPYNLSLGYFWANNEYPYRERIFFSKDNRPLLPIPLPRFISLPSANFENDEYCIHQQGSTQGVVVSQDILNFSAIIQGMHDFDSFAKSPSSHHTINKLIAINLDSSTIGKGVTVLDFLYKNKIVPLAETVTTDDEWKKREEHTKIILPLSQNFNIEYLTAAQNVIAMLSIDIPKIDIELCCKAAIPLHLLYLVTDLAFIGTDILFGRPKPIDTDIQQHFQNLCKKYRSLKKSSFDLQKYYISPNEWFYFLDNYENFGYLFQYVYDKAHPERKTFSHHDLLKEKIPFDAIVRKLKTSIAEKIKALENRIFIENNKNLESSTTFKVELHRNGLTCGAHRNGYYSITPEFGHTTIELPFFSDTKIYNADTCTEYSIPVIAQELTVGHLVLFDAREIVEDEGITTGSATTCKPLAVINKKVSEEKNLKQIGTIFSVTDMEYAETIFQIVEYADEESKYSIFDFYSIEKNQVDHSIEEILCGGYYDKILDKRPWIRHKQLETKKEIISAQPISSNVGSNTIYHWLANIIIFAMKYKIFHD